MPLISLRPLLDHAALHGYAVPAFNVGNLEQIQSVLMAAAACDAPVILQASSGARRYAGDVFLKHLFKAAVLQYPHLPIVVHQDHGVSPSICLAAIRNGFSSVMMDGSLAEDGQTPTTFDYNVRVTRQVVEVAHAVGVSVEGEIGCLGNLETGAAGEEDGIGANRTLARHEMLTDPDEAVTFVAETGVDALAIAVGTSHGAYKFSSPPTTESLAICHIHTLHQRLPDTHFVLHGASSVGQDVLALIRQYGGDLPETYGVPVSEIQRAIPYGVRKVNIDTDLRLAFTAAVRETYVTQPRLIDPRELLAIARDAMAVVCQARFEAFGAAGQASRLLAALV